MGEICASGSVGGEGGNVLAYPATWPAMPRDKAPTARPKVPMRRRGADCPVVATKRGNARGAKRAGHRHWAGSTGNGRSPAINGRRQPSCGGTSRMNREVHVRICERLAVKFPSPTRHFCPWSRIDADVSLPPDSFRARRMLSRTNSGHSDAISAWFDRRETPPIKVILFAPLTLHLARQFDFPFP
jgi:hypothetical protein